MKRFLARACALLLGACAAATPGSAQSWRRLWVLRPPDALVEYDVATFGRIRTIAVPRYLAGAPEYVSVNAAGQVLFQPPRDVQWASPGMAGASGHMWFWNGASAREAAFSTAVTTTGAAGRSVREVAIESWLSARGDSVYRFESRFSRSVDADGLDKSVRSAARVGRTGLDDLADAGRDTVATLPETGSCPCTTGVCTESCPDWRFWAPESGVGDVFLVTRWIPGQLGSTYEETRVYRRSGGGWSWSRLPAPLEEPLAASTAGDLIVAAEPDAACCGWENDSSDRLILVRRTERSVVYDEFERFANADYDVSFSPSDARLAPGDRLLAYTLVASGADSTGEVRLSSGGKADPAELARVRYTVAQMPQVEVVDMVTGRRVATIPRTGVVGWLTEHELLVARGGHLAVYELRGGTTRVTPITVRTAADAFLR